MIELQALLDAALSSLRGNHEHGMSWLVGGLDAIRARSSRREWAEAIERCRRHELWSVLGEDPFTRRAREKPRGHAGDPVTIDYLYGDAAPPPGTTELGRTLFAFTAGASSLARAVRERRALLAREIDELAAHTEQARVLSVACGHLREADDAWAIRSWRLGELVAVDQDPDALAEVERAHEGRPIRIVEGSVRDLIAGRLALGHFDLVYAAGLYDHLEGQAAERLTAVLFGMLRPGGAILLDNFATGFPCGGYMEAFMSWPLISRGPEALSAVAAGVPPGEVASSSTFFGLDHAIVYHRVERARGAQRLVPGLRAVG